MYYTTAISEHTRFIWRRERKELMVVIIDLYSIHTYKICRQSWNSRLTYQCKGEILGMVGGM